MLYRSTRHGSVFDKKLFEKFSNKNQRLAMHSLSLKSKIQFFINKLLRAIDDSFKTLVSDEPKASDAEGKDLTNLQSYQFLEMLLKVLPPDQKKL